MVIREDRFPFNNRIKIGIGTQSAEYDSDAKEDKSNAEWNRRIDYSIP
jgi:hypothetical protein